MQHNSFITSTNLRQHVVANKPTNKYKRCMSSHKTILCHRVFFFWPNPKYCSADYPAASVIDAAAAVTSVRQDGGCYLVLRHLSFSLLILPLFLF